MEAPGKLIAVAIKFAARVQGGHNDLGGRPPLFFVKIHGDTPAVVFDRYAVVLVDGYVDFVAEAHERFIDGIVYDLVDQVVQPGSPRAADIHRRSFAHRLQALKNFDILGGIILSSRFPGRLIFCLLGQLAHLSLNAHGHDDTGMFFVVGGTNDGRALSIFEFDDDLVALQDVQHLQEKARVESHD